MQVRKTVVEWLDSKGLLRGTQDNEMSVPFCSRSKDIIEPVLKPQWWVNCQGMAQDGIKAAQDGSLEIIPSDFEATWYRYCVTLTHTSPQCNLTHTSPQCKECIATGTMRFSA